MNHKLAKTLKIFAMSGSILLLTNIMAQERCPECQGGKEPGGKPTNSMQGMAGGLNKGNCCRPGCTDYPDCLKKKYYGQ